MKAKIIIVVIFSVLGFIGGVLYYPISEKFYKSDMLNVYVINERSFIAEISFKNPEEIEAISTSNSSDEIKIRIEKSIIELIGDLITPLQLKHVIDEINQEKLAQKIKLLRESDESRKDNLKI